MKLRLPMHGRTHDPDRGSDPLEFLRRFWRFNVQLLGGWGYLQFSDSFDLDDAPDPLAVGGTWGGVIEEDSGDGLLIGSTALLLLKGDTVVAEVNTGETITLQGPGGTLFQMTDGVADLHLPTGGNIIFDL